METSLARTVKTLHCYHLVTIKTAVRMQFFAAIRYRGPRGNWQELGSRAHGPNHGAPGGPCGAGMAAVALWPAACFGDRQVATSASSASGRVTTVSRRPRIKPAAVAVYRDPVARPRSDVPPAAPGRRRHRPTIAPHPTMQGFAHLARDQRGMRGAGADRSSRCLPPPQSPRHRPCWYRAASGSRDRLPPQAVRALSDVERGASDRDPARSANSRSRRLVGARPVRPRPELSRSMSAIRLSASCWLINPSCTRSIAIRSAARGVRFAERVCRIHNLLSSMVNSTSWTSPNSFSSCLRMSPSSAAQLRQSAGDRLVGVGRSASGDDVLALGIEHEIDHRLLAARSRDRAKTRRRRRRYARHCRTPWPAP